MPSTDCGLISIVVAIGSGAIGYYVRAVLANKSADRKEDWDHAQKLMERVNELTDRAKQFYCNPPRSFDDRKALGIQIQGMMRALGQHAYSLSRNLGNPHIDAYQKKLRQAISLGFSEQTNIPLADDSILLFDIEAACNSLVGLLLNAYARKYR